MNAVPFRLYVLSRRARMGSDPAGAVAALARAGLTAFMWRETDLAPADTLDWLRAVLEAIRGPIQVGPSLPTGIHAASGWSGTGPGTTIPGSGTQQSGGVSYPWQIAPRPEQIVTPDPIHHRAPHGMIGAGSPDAAPDRVPAGSTAAPDRRYTNEPATPFPAHRAFDVSVIGGSYPCPPLLHLFVHDRADLALAAGCHLHLDETSIPTIDARRLLPPKQLLGRSIRSVEDAMAAEREGADFVAFGPVYGTPPDRAGGSPQGLARLHAACASVTVPVFASGGVTPDRIAECRDAGAYGVAMSRAVWDDADPVAALGRCLDALTGS